MEPFSVTRMFDRSQIFCSVDTTNNADVEEDCASVGGGSLNLTVYGR